MIEKIIDHTLEVIEEKNKAIERAMVKIGTTAVGEAVILLTEQDAVDTGRLRNSITYATHEKTDGKSYNWKDSRKGRGIKGGSDKTSTKAMPEEGSVYIGTNVNYAPYIEIGAKGKSPRPYLKPAIADHTNEYKKIIEEELKG